MSDSTSCAAQCADEQQLGAVTPVENKWNHVLADDDRWPYSGGGDWKREDYGLYGIFENVRREILPHLHPNSLYELDKLRADVYEEPWPEIPVLALGEHLNIAIVYDPQEQPKPVTTQLLAEWGVSFGDVCEVAAENLRNLPRTSGEPRSGVYYSHNLDGHDASRLLLLDEIRSLHVEGDPIAVTPTPYTLMVTGSADLRGLKSMLTNVQKLFQRVQAHVSFIPLQLIRDEWKSWSPAPDHPLYDDYNNLRVLSLARDYAVGNKILNKLCDKRDRGFVASYKVAEEPYSGRLFTFASWAGGISSWLPRTDIIGFTKIQDKKRGLFQNRAYRWDQAFPVVGHRMKPLGIDPPWYEVTTFPTEDEFAAMGEERLSSLAIEI
jgi:hypothetical protein